MKMIKENKCIENRDDYLLSSAQLSPDFQFKSFHALDNSQGLLFSPCNGLREKKISSALSGTLGFLIMLRNRFAISDMLNRGSFLSSHREPELSNYKARARLAQHVNSETLPYKSKNLKYDIYHNVIKIGGYDINENI